MGNAASSARRLNKSSNSINHRVRLESDSFLTHRFFSSSTAPAIEKPSTNRELKQIEKILIANRGEIACRIIKTARSLGLRTVAVYSDADQSSLHVRRADEAVHIGPPAAQLSYLSTAAILDAARRTGADAIHPGYGFLSENAKFAEACQDSGITFIGPSAKAISLMGDKSASKKLMSAASVPVVPGYHGEDQSCELLQAEADRIGYPVLIKPVLGGGGKGMRIVQRSEDFLDSLTSAIRESRASFGDTRVLIEKYIAQPRHIEVQIFGDKCGNVVHLFERDCSVQRRHQKIIEEAPAPLMTDEFRRSIGQSAVDAAKAVNYENAGTVEFIVDTRTGEYFFMEMNTRLQVEHPVTEMVTRQDLVEWQIRVANGEVLPLQQSEIHLSGHAFEARVYAENVPRGFLPAAGVLHHYSPPETSSTVRVETGVEESDSVSVHYDPMIAKLVVWGVDRQIALAKLYSCLSSFEVGGLPTNIGFLKKLARHPAFRKGDVETHFIEHFRDDLLYLSDELPAHLGLFAALAAVGMCSRESSRQPVERDVSSLKHVRPAFRLNHDLRRNIHLDWESASGAPTKMTLEVTYLKDNEFLVKFPGQTASQVRLKRKMIDPSGNKMTVEINGASYSVSFGFYSQKSAFHIHVWKEDSEEHFSVPLVENPGAALVAGRSRAERSRKKEADEPGVVLAPMSGMVVKILTEAGKAVEAGDPLLLLEAMKMEHTVKAQVSGVVTAVEAAAGQQVNDGRVLFRIQASKS